MGGDREKGKLVVTCAAGKGRAVAAGTVNVKLSEYRIVVDKNGGGTVSHFAQGMHTELTVR